MLLTCIISILSLQVSPVSLSQVADNIISCCVETESEHILIKECEIASEKGMENNSDVRELFLKVPMTGQEFKELFTSQNSDGSWPDINYTDEHKGIWQPSLHAIRIHRLAIKYCQTKNPEVLSCVLKAIDYWSLARAKTVQRVLGADMPESWGGKVKSAAVPENWEQFALLVENDTMLTSAVKRKISSEVSHAAESPDRAESALARLPDYRYLREKVYPKLRSVKFEFHMHRVGMVKDTVHTTEIDSVYMSGLDALRNMDYKRAVSLLRPYRDYNSALALASADYNHTALDVLRELPSDNSRVCYLMALVLSRLDQKKEASKYLDLAIAYDTQLRYRVNLDPELSGYVNNL